MQSVSHLLKMMWKDKLKPVPAFPQDRGRLGHSPSSPLFRRWRAGVCGAETHTHIPMGRPGNYSFKALSQDDENSVAWARVAEVEEQQRQGWVLGLRWSRGTRAPTNVFVLGRPGSVSCKKRGREPGVVCFGSMEKRSQ